MDKKEEIKKYIHNRFYGSEIKKDDLNNLAKQIISEKIVDGTEEYVQSIINKYIRYSKKKDIYYFETTKVIKLKSLSPPK